MKYNLTPVMHVSYWIAYDKTCILLIHIFMAEIKSNDIYLKLNKNIKDIIKGSVVEYEI